jgi:hypothetical protein
MKKIVVLMLAALFGSALSMLFYSPCFGETRLVVCDKGVGNFNAKSVAGVDVSVGAAKGAGFAIRACEAKLSWGHEDIVVAQAAQADVDLMEVNLGLGSLVVAFDIKAAEADPHTRYAIYSLTKPPRLLRTITGEDFFRAADTRLDESVEIWTTDAVAANGFEGLPLSAFDFAPTVVLRFEKKQLMDVSSEFRPHYDQQIASLRSQLSSEQLKALKESDGKLASGSPAENSLIKDQPHELEVAKAKVLEIAWCYLYSDREQEAWNALAEMWPAADVGRIRAAMLDAQGRGLRSQVDGVSHKGPPLIQRKNSIVYQHADGYPDKASSSDLPTFTDTPAVQILLRLPPPRDPDDWGEERQMELVIDEAGKVRSAKMKEKPDDNWPEKMKADWLAKLKRDPNKDWIDASAGWRYIPALKEGYPKAFLLKINVGRDR